MNAAVLKTTGQPPRFGPFADPVAAEDEVLVRVTAAAIKPIDKALAQGTHYASGGSLPAVCGIDGVGALEDGSRVFFMMPRRPFGAMAEYTVVRRRTCLPAPDGVDDATLAAIMNPGLSAWGALTWRAELKPGEKVLILGATGVAGKLAIQSAKLMDARCVVAAGRDEDSLAALPALGADAVISLEQKEDAVMAEFATEGGKSGFDVVIDYLWGRPAELLLSAITRHDFERASARTRYVQVGESAGANISLPAEALRSSRLEMMGSGSGNQPPREMWPQILRDFLGRVQSGQLSIDTETVPLAEIEAAWRRDTHGRRLVVMPWQPSENEDAF